jgi:hypothetical protein
MRQLTLRGSAPVTGLMSSPIAAESAWRHSTDEALSAERLERLEFSTVDKAFDGLGAGLW